MLEISQLDSKDRKRVRDFIRLPFTIYCGYPQWVPPLELEIRSIFNPSRHPFYKDGEAAFFMAYQHNQPVGRIAAINNTRYNQFNQEQTGFFYWFECIDDGQVSDALFEAASEWLRERKLNKVIGPKGFTPLDGAGILIKGFEHRPAFGMPYTPPYYPGLIEAAGFAPHRETVSGHMARGLTHFPPRIHELSERVMRRRGLRIRSFQNRSELRALIPDLKTLYNQSLAGTRENVPLNDDDLNTMANQLLWFADPRLLKLVVKGEQPVGFLMAYPDISAALQKTRGKLLPFGWISLLRELKKTQWINLNGAGLIEAYRGSGGTAILFSEITKSILDNPRYQYADVVQIGVENENMQREMENFGIVFYKKHRIYAKTLSGD